MMFARGTALSCLLTLAVASDADAQQGPVVVEVERFASLPSDVRQPEGLDVDPISGDVFVGTFDARMPEIDRNNRLLRLDGSGRLQASRSFGSAPLTGIAVRGTALYVLNFGAAVLQRLPLNFNERTKVEDVAKFGALRPAAPAAREVPNPDGSRDRIAFGSNGLPGLNGLVFDKAGNVYVSDSFQGAIYRINDVDHCRPCEVETISRDPLLGTSNAVLPFGANGVAFDEGEHNLYITNAGDGRLLRMAMPDGPVSVVAESLPGADGLVYRDGLFWVAANQADVVAGVDASGRIRVRAGSFSGIDPGGAPLGLLFPASAASGGDGELMIVTNLSLSLTPAKGDEWEEQTALWTLSRFRIPKRAVVPPAH